MIKIEKSQNTTSRNQRGAIIPDPMGVKRVIKDCMKNSMPTNVIIKMKWTNSRRDPNYQNPQEDIDK